MNVRVPIVTGPSPEGRENSGFSPICYETSGTYPIIPSTSNYVWTQVACL